MMWIISFIIWENDAFKLRNCSINLSGYFIVYAYLMRLILSIIIVSLAAAMPVLAVILPALDK